MRRRGLWATLAVVAMIALGTVVLRKRMEVATDTNGVDEASLAAAREREDEQLAEAFAATRQALRDARAITLDEVANQFDADYSALTANPKIEGYPILRRVPLRRSDAEPLVTVLTNRNSYFPAGDGWACIFQPHHVLQLIAPRRTVTLVICVHCGDIAFKIGDVPIGPRSVLPPANGELARLLSKHLSPRRLPDA